MNKSSKTPKHKPAQHVHGEANKFRVTLPKGGGVYSKPDKAPPTALHRSLLAALPTAPAVLKSLQDAAALLPKLEAELLAARKDGAVTLARAYVVLHRLTARAAELLQVSDSGKVFGPTMKQWATVEIPAAFDQAGVPHVVLDEGYRVGLSSRYAASIKPDMKQEAYAWLEANGLGELIVGTVNASTLSAAAKREVEGHNKEFPSDLFNIAVVPNTSVTVTGK